MAVAEKPVTTDDLPETVPKTPRCWTGVLVHIDETNGVLEIIPKSCGRWDCPDCAQFKSRRYAAQIFQADPERHIVLTCDPSRYHTIGEAVADLKDKVRRLASQLRKGKKNGRGVYSRKRFPIEYAAVYEPHDSGWPHVHLATWGSFIPHSILKALWHKLTGATIVDISKIEKGTEHYHNWMKYLDGKMATCRLLPNNVRRVTFSRGYHRNHVPVPIIAEKTRGRWFFARAWPTAALAIALSVCEGSVDPEASDNHFRLVGDVSRMPDNALCLEDRAEALTSYEHGCRYAAQHPQLTAPQPPPLGRFKNLDDFMGIDR